MAVFAVSQAIFYYFVERRSITKPCFDETSAMTEQGVNENHCEIKNYDEPESYHKAKQTEMIRNVK